jgi:hypothetical protein
MGFSIALLLMHSEFVPAEAREALKAANAAPLEERTRALETAAQILRREAALDCTDARELVGLHEGAKPVNASV